jgi:protein-disulfide isomerase
MRSERTVGALGFVASLVPALAGLVASAMLVVDYVRPAPVFCVEGGGCEALRHTLIAAPLGVPLPFFGVAGFLAIGVASLLGGPRARVAQLALSACAGLVGATLLTVQVLLGRFCPYCCVADASGVVAAVVAAGRLRLAPASTAPRALSYAGGAALLLALLAPLLVGFRATPAPPVPQTIREEMERTPRGEVTVVDFVDFECPFCRMTHAELEPILQQHPDRVRLVRRQVPLLVHPHARDAARAACCGERFGKGDTMANALFTAPVDALTPDGCERIAQSIGIALGPYRACVADPATDARIDADRAVFKDSGGLALPTIWINGEELVGAQSRETLEKAIEGALARAGS